MHILLCILAILSLLLSASRTTAEPAADKGAAPTAAGIEKLLRESLANDDFHLAGMVGFKKASLLAFQLVKLDQLSPSRWRAETNLVFDFGPPPDAILGFERERLGRYQLRLIQQGEQLALVRFSPTATLHLLLASGR